MIWLHTYRKTSTYSLMILHSTLPLKIHAVESYAQKASNMTGRVDRQLVCYIQCQQNRGDDHQQEKKPESLHLMNKELQPTDSIILLCVTITKTLSWSQHITCIAKKRQQNVSISWAVLETSFLTKLLSPSTRLTSDLLWNMLPQYGMEQILRLRSC